MGWTSGVLRASPPPSPVSVSTVSGRQIHSRSELCLYGTNHGPRVDQSDVRLPFSLEQFYHNPIVETSRLTANPELQGQTSLEQDHNLSQSEHSITMGLDQ